MWSIRKYKKVVPDTVCSSMKPVFLFHGIYGSPDENWFPWLKAELESQGCTVHIPHFPTHENLKPEDWWNAFEAYEQYLDDDSILIGHSLGTAFALKVIEKYPVKAAFLVATAFGKTDNEFTPIMSPIADQNFDWEKIRSHCKEFHIFHSDNDPYLPMEKAKELAENLHTEVTWVKGAKHFNASAGYDRFPLLLTEINSIL